MLAIRKLRYFLLLVLFSFAIMSIARKVNFVKRKKIKQGVDLLNNKQQKSVEEIAREERLAYFREWRANNKDKVKKHNATYWEKRAKRIIAEREAKNND